MASVQSDSLLERNAVTAHKWANRHKKARRGKRRRHSDFIRKSLVHINVEYGLEPHLITLQPAQAGKLALQCQRVSAAAMKSRSEEHTSELQSRGHLVC